MADPIRLYSPNPDAPTSYGGPDTPEPSRLARLLMQPLPSPGEMVWGALPPQVRDSYSSLGKLLLEM
ncbi:MAG: hypothetical protein AB7F89_27590, partial [Pirellulaceae bacterium]